MIKKFTIEWNKNKYTVSADSLKSLKEAIFEEISVPPQNLRIIKPPIKTEQAFNKLADGTSIFVMGNTVEKLKKFEKTSENGIEYKQFIGYITYVTSSIQLLRVIREFKEFCMKQTDEKNDADKLMAIDLTKIFNELDDQTRTKPVSPIDIMTSWAAYSDKFDENYGLNLNGILADHQQDNQGIQLTTEGGRSQGGLSQLPAPQGRPHAPIQPTNQDFIYHTMDAIQFLLKIFEMMQYADNPNFDDDETAPNAMHDMFRVNYIATESDKSCEIEDVLDLETVDRTRHMWMLPCVVDKGPKTLFEGIIKYFSTERMLVRDIYGVDITYEEKIRGISYLPPYVFVRVNRFEAPEKAAQEIVYNKVLDLAPICHKEYGTKLKEGIEKRDLLFQKFDKTEEFKAYSKSQLEANPKFTELQIKYSFYEKKMSVEQYDSYVHRPQGTAPTGQYNLLGLLTHKGNKIDDQGYFRAVVNKKARDWYIFKDGEVLIKGLAEALAFTGFEDTNETETAHVLLFKAIKF